jgi:hypothetical protein
MNITTTIQAKEKPEWVDKLFNGKWSVGGFPLRGKPKNAHKGDWLYIIHRGRIVGRCRIKKIKEHNGIIIEEVGTIEQDETVNARCSIHVECPGERAPKRIPQRGHMGIRYVPKPRGKGEVCNALQRIRFQ